MCNFVPIAHVCFLLFFYYALSRDKGVMSTQLVTLRILHYVPNCTARTKGQATKQTNHKTPGNLLSMTRHLDNGHPHRSTEYMGALRFAGPPVSTLPKP